MKLVFIIFTIYLCTPSLCFFGEKNGDAFDSSTQRQSFVALRHNTTDGPIFAQGVIIHHQVIMVPAPNLINVQKETIIVDYPTLRDGRFKKVSEIIFHPDYKPCNGYRGFALVVLNETYYCDPIYLPNPVFDSGLQEKKCDDLYFNENIAKDLLFNPTPEFTTEGILHSLLESAERQSTDEIHQKEKGIEKVPEVGVTLTLSPYKDEEGQCQNLIPNGFNDNKTISDIVCEATGQVIKNSKSFFRTCNFKSHVFTRKYLYDYHFYAPICATSQSKGHKYEYRVLYHRENVNDVKSWIVDVVNKTVGINYLWPHEDQVYN